MSNPNSSKGVSLAASLSLLIWVLVVLAGLINIIYAFMQFEPNFLISLLYESPFVGIACLLMFFSSRSISISLINLVKNKHWKEPLKFIKNIFLQAFAAILTSVLTVIIFRANNYSDFFLIFSSISFFFTVVYLGFCIYYYRYDIPKTNDL